MVALVEAKSQVKEKSIAETLIEQLDSPSGQAIDAEQLRIQIGRRFEHGVTGNERRELTEDQATAVLDAIKLPVTDGIDPVDYEGGIPNIRITVGDEVLFNQARDGVISTNQFQPEQQAQAESTATSPEPQAEKAYNLAGDRQIEESVIAADASEGYLDQGGGFEPSASVEPAPAVAIEPEPPEVLAGDELVASAVAAEAIPDLLQEIVNPLNEKLSQPVEAGLGAYTIQLDGKEATVSKGDEVLLQAADGEVTQSSLSSEDTQALRSLLENSSSAESWTVPIQSVDPELMAAEPPPAISVAQQQIEALPAGGAKAFFQKLGADIGAQAKQALQSIRERIDSTPFMTVQPGDKFSDAEVIAKGLERGAQWIDSAPAAIKNAVTTLVTDPGKSVEVVGGALEKSGQWLASRPEAMREQRAARNALAMYQEGNNRTNETSFERDGFRVAFDAKTDQYSLSDTNTNETLMRFDAVPSIIPGRSVIIGITEKAEISREQYQNFDATARSGEVVRGSPEAESHHAALSEGFADFSRQVAKAMDSNDCKTKHYRIQIGEDDSLTISAQGGNELYHQDRDQTISRLGQKDFENLGIAQNIVERPAAPLESATNLHPAPTSIEID